MKVVHVRVEEELYDQLQDMADEEREPLAVIVRRAVRQHVRQLHPDVRQPVSAHEGTGRVR